jgi:hypothetical protein
MMEGTEQQTGGAAQRFDTVGKQRLRVQPNPVGGVGWPHARLKRANERFDAQNKFKLVYLFDSSHPYHSGL